MILIYAYNLSTYIYFNSLGNSMLEDKLKLYSGEDGIDMESLERALTLVKRRGEALKKLPFLEEVEGMYCLLCCVVF